VLDLPADAPPSVTEHRVEYDVEAVQAAVAAAGLPERTGQRLGRGK
jgi:hypothetical protein